MAISLGLRLKIFVIKEELLIEPLRERVLSKIMPGFRKDLQFRSAKLDNNSGLIGAVRNLIEKGAA